MRVPGATPPPERLARGPLEIGPHRLSARIAAGRRSTTYLADAPESPTAIRVIEDPALVDQLRGEWGPDAYVAADGHHAFVQPLVVGESLATVLDVFVAEGRALPLPVALTVAMSIAARLDALGRPHLDLVPQHVLLGYDGAVHVIDPAPESGRGDAPGREGYRAPEHLQGERLDATTDVFLLGILLFEMTTGARLFDPSRSDLEARISKGEMPRPRDLVGDGYPIELQLVLRKLMRPSRVGRFPSARAAQDALRLVATTRADVGAGPLASWLRTEFASRKAVWADLLGAETLDRPAPAQARPRAPSRAQTRPSSFLGAGAPTIEELRLDSSTIEAVRKQIQVDGLAENITEDGEQAALRAELAQMKQRRTELPALPRTAGETTSPGMRVDRDTSEDTHEDLDVPTPYEAPPPPPATRPKGLAASPPPTMVPELPTEVTHRFGPLPQPGSLGLEPSDSDAATSLDELEPVAGPVAEIDMLGLPSIASADEFSLGFGAEPGSLADLSADSLLAPTTDKGPAPAADLEPPPPTPAPSSAPDLSEDLVLEPFANPLLDGQLGGDAWSSELLAEPPPPAPPGDPAGFTGPSEGPELGDTIQDDAPEELLRAEELAQLQRAVEVIPERAFGVALPPEGPPTWEPPAPPTEPTPPAEEATDEAPVPLPLEALMPADDETAPRPAPDPVAPATSPDRPPPFAAPAEPRGLGLSPPPQGQASIATQVVRDRILPTDPDSEAATAQTEAPAPIDWFDPPPGEAHDRPEAPTPLIEIEAPPSMTTGTEDEPSYASMVIPISDDELEATERRRRWVGVVGGVLVALLAAGGAAAWQLGLLSAPERAPTSAVGAPPGARTVAPTEIADDRAPPTRAAATAPPKTAAPARTSEETAAEPDETTPVEPVPDEPETGAAAAAPEASDAPVEEVELVAPKPRPASEPAAPAADAASNEAAPVEPAKSPRRAAKKPSKRRAPPPESEPAATPPAKSWTLTVEALPSTAAVRIDGQSVNNNAPVLLSNPGPVTVTVSQDGYETVTKRVPRTDDVVSVLILLKKKL